MEPKIYEEWEIIKRNGKEFKRFLTERGTVSIDAETAKIMNRNTANSNIEYVLRVKNPKDGLSDEEKELRAELFEEAKELGLNVPNNIKTETLQNKIKEAIEK